MKNLLKLTLVLVLAFVVGTKAYQAWTSDEVSDVVLANAAALAANEDDNGGGEAIITCSAKCNDGVGRCWLLSGGEFCVFSGSQSDSCTGYPCRKYDGSTYV